MKKRYKAVAVCVCLALFAAGCTGKKVSQQNHTEEETAEQAEERAKQAKLDVIEPFAYGNIDGLDLEPGTYFSLIGKSSSGEYWKAVKAGAEDAVADINERLGYEGSDKVRVVYSGPSDEGDVDEQVNILDEELARYPAAVGIAQIDSQSCAVQFDLANLNGIPIVTFDSSSTYQNIMASVGTDNTAAATEAAARLSEAVGEKGEILIFSHDSKSYSSQERVNAFTAEIQNNHPGLSVAGVYYMNQFEEIKQSMAEERSQVPVLGNTAAENGVEATAEEISDEDVYEYIFAKYPNVNAVYATDGTAVRSVADICEELEKTELKIVGFDADSDVQEALEEGRITGLIVQNPYGMGYAAIVAEARSALEMGNEAVVDTGYIWVTPDNLDDPEVQQMLY